jgi:hypothetical protein
VDDRRKGLSIKQQEEMYDAVLKLTTHLLGMDGSKGKLQEFEETDDKLDKKIESLTECVGKLEKKFIKVIAPFVAVPGTVGAILLIIGLVQKLKEIM